MSLISAAYLLVSGFRELCFHKAATHTDGDGMQKNETEERKKNNNSDDEKSK